MLSDAPNQYGPQLFVFVTVFDGDGFKLVENVQVRLLTCFGFDDGRATNASGALREKEVCRYNANHIKTVETGTKAILLAYFRSAFGSPSFRAAEMPQRLQPGP